MGQVASPISVNTARARPGGGAVWVRFPNYPSLSESRLATSRIILQLELKCNWLPQDSFSRLSVFASIPRQLDQR